MCLANVFSRFVFRFARARVGEMMDSYIIVKLCAAIRYMSRGLGPGPRLDQVIDDGWSHAIFSAGVVFSTHRSVWRKLVAV